MLIISIEGLIGCGKSTLLRRIEESGLCSSLKIKTIQEPVDKWRKDGMLQKYYNDKDFALPFQIYTTSTFIEQYKTIDNSTDIIISDRCAISGLYQFAPITDIPDVALDSLKVIIEEAIKPYRPNIFIYIKTSVSTAQQRMHSRNREEEATIPDEYQEKLKKNIEAFLLIQNLKGCKIITLDGEKSQDKIYTELLNKLNKIL